MATKKTTTTTKAVEETSNNDVSQSVVDENVALKKQLEELQAQMKLMAEMMSKPIETAMPKRDKKITFVSLISGTVVLKGSSFWYLEGRFDSKTFSEREAILIVNNMSNLIRSGMVYITDAEFVEENNLGEIYATLLTDTQIKELLDNNVNYVVDVYKNASDGQKQVIIDMIIDKRINKEKVDANILIELGNLCGKNLVDIDED